MNAIEDRLPGLRWSVLLRHALSDLRFRPGKSLLSAFSVMLTVIYFLLLSYFGDSLYRYQERALDRDLPNRVRASCKDATDLGQRFTRQRLREVSAWGGVRKVFPRVEVGVKVSLLGGSAISLPAEGTVVGDDALAASRLRQGRTVSGTDAREAVLPCSVFEKLGGVLKASGPYPKQLRVEVKRTTGGRTEVQTLLLALVGLLDESADPRVYLPLSLAEQLDQWCAHQIEELTGPGGRTEMPRLAVRTMRAYGTAEQESRAAEEAHALGVDVRQVRRFVTLEPFPEESLRLDGLPLQARASSLLQEVHAFLLRSHSSRSIVSYEVHLRQEDQRDASEVATTLGMARPTFTFALPQVSVDVQIDGSPLALVGSLADDPHRFEVGLRQGRWLSAENAGHEALLPVSLIRQLYPGKPIADCLDCEVEIRCMRDRGVSDADTLLILRGRLVGIVDGPICFASVAWLREIALWRQGRLLFNEKRGCFEAPIEVSRRSGALRCNIDLTDADSAWQMVKRLEGRGYQVEHRLAEREGLRKLARVLVCLVLLFVVGFGTCAFLTVLISNTLHLASKTYEIGILRAHGWSRRQIVSLFMVQGLLAGLAAFVMGGVLASVMEPFLSELARSTFH
jgi:hypothetical protein